jgi:two-component system, cell cycle sensor histidine kinase and response regulator CckA
MDAFGSSRSIRALRYVCLGGILCIAIASQVPVIGWQVRLPFWAVVFLGVSACLMGWVEKIQSRRETRHRRASDMLRDSHFFLESIIENIPDMIFVKEAKTLRFVLFNKAGEAIVGHPRENLIGKKDFDFFPREQAAFFVDKDWFVLAKKQLLDIPEEKIQTPRGERILHTKKIPICDEQGEPIYLLGISEDITLRKRQETELLQGRKMSAMGHLAAGIAHEINNPLGVILGFAQALLKHTGIPPSETDGLSHIEREALRCKTLVQNLLLFSRSRAPGRTWEDPLKVLDSALSLVQTQAKVRGIEVKRILGRLPARVFIDTHLIQQVIINLCSNGIDAMAKDGVLTVTLTSDDREWTIAVADTGQGILPEIRDRIFDPFFTTKEPGRGTGMGLSLVFDTIQKHQGRIELQSECGHGSAFTVHLPLDAPPEAAEKPAA